MLVTKGYKAKIVLVTVWVYIVVPGLHLVKGKQCSDLANNLPVLRFCSGDTFRSKSIVIIDGHYADTLKNVNNCTCTSRALFNHTSKLIFNDIPSSSLFNNNNNCGTKVVFEQQNYEERLKMCGGDGALPINDTINDITVNITLVKVAYPANTNYSFCIEFDSGNLMDVTCHHSTYLTTQYHEPIDITSVKGAFSTMSFDEETSIVTTAPKTHISMPDLSCKSRKESEDILQVNGIIIAAVIGWVLALFFGAVSVALLYVRKREQKFRRQTEQSYTDIGTRELDSRYNTIQQPQHNHQEYEQVA